MRMRFNRYLYQPIVVLMFALLALTSHAQWVRTSYFMEGAHYRLRLNPALAPSRGYVDLPAVGPASASFHSNTLGFNDLIDVIKNKKDADYFLADDFVKKLQEMNNASVSAASDIISVGWWHGNNFLSVNIGVRGDGGVKVPKEAFEYLRDMRGMNSHDYTDYYRDIGGEMVDLTTYIEMGFGYSRQLSDRFSLGGRIKGLLGLGNARLTVREGAARINMQGVDPNVNWSAVNPFEMIHVRGTSTLDVKADLETSFEGLELLYNDKDYIDDIHFNAGHSGVSGLGAALDAGLSFRVTDAFTLSASVIDLGFIKWSKGCTQIAHSNTEDLHFTTSSPGNYREFANIIGAGDVFNPDLLRLTIDENASKSRNTSLNSTIVAGADYAFAGDKVRLGALFTHAHSVIEDQDEITFSVNVHPHSLVDVAVSYSPLLSRGKSVGVAFKAGPLFVGTDYIFTGESSRCFNGMVGISIPLGKKEVD